ncbi:MAG: hypothetical protein AAGI38_22670 [Bacteroidota bacterium]
MKYPVRCDGSFLAIMLFFCLIVLSVGCQEEKDGCTDPSAANFDPEATNDNGNCELSVPSAYVFTRGQNSTVDNALAVSRQLMIQDLRLNIQALGMPNATPVSETDLLAYYLTDPENDSISILSPVGNDLIATDTVYSGLGVTIGLSGAISPLFGTDTETRTRLAEIAANSQTALLGTPEVYTTPDGLDLSAYLPALLTGAVLIHQVTDSIIASLDTLDNISFGNSGGTAVEHAIDQLMGYAGTARYYREFSLEDLSNEVQPTGEVPFAKDRDGNGSLDYASEYNFSFARWAAARELTSGAPNFTDDLFDALLLARAAAEVGDEEAATRQVAIMEYQMAMEEILAATVIHHLNNVIGHMGTLGTSAYAQADHNADWAHMYGYLTCFRFFTGTRLTQVESLLNSTGENPIYDLPGTGTHEDYLTQLGSIRTQIKNTMGFSDEAAGGF